MIRLLTSFLRKRRHALAARLERERRHRLLTAWLQDDALCGVARQERLNMDALRERNGARLGRRPGGVR
jgi:hypothetical protein